MQFKMGFIISFDTKVQTYDMICSLIITNGEFVARMSTVTKLRAQNECEIN